MKKSPAVKKRERIAYAVIIIAVLILLIPFPVDVKFDAVEVKFDDPDYLVKRKVRIDGFYHLNIFRDEFRGRVLVDDYMDRIDEWESGGFSNAPIAGDSLLITYINPKVYHGHHYKHLAKKHWYSDFDCGRFFSDTWILFKEDPEDELSDYLLIVFDEKDIEKAKADKINRYHSLIAER